MSTTKRPPGRLRQVPGAARGPLGAPLPLVTQPLVPVERADNPMAALRPEAGTALFGIQAVANATHARERQPLVPDGPPPEIGLNQHILPDEPPDPRLALIVDPDSERSAAFRVLRHHVLEIGRPQVVVVSSPRPRDGKTTTAVNLALALAECGRARVLLLETNLQNPQLAAMFKIMPTWCFAEQLAAHRHQPHLPWSMIDLPQLWLHVGAINPRIEKLQLLDGPAFAIAIERLLQAGYDHIVIDAPSVLGSADVNLMADAADTVVLALRAKVSTTRDLRKAFDQIGANMIAGTVLVEG